MQPLFTIGYEGRSLSDFLTILKENQIERIIDVRRNPISRKPGFSKTALSQALQQANIAYTHMVALGTPTNVRDFLKQTHDYDLFFDKVEDYLLTQDDAIASSLDMALSQRCALLCFERNHKECHRMSVAVEIVKLSNCGLSIEHIE